MSAERPSAVFYVGVGVLLVCGGFLWGVQAERNYVFPRKLLERASNAIGRTSLFGKPHFMFPKRYEASGVTTHEPERTSPGATMISGYWRQEGAWTPQLRLVGADGDVLHRWTIRPTKLWEASPYEDLYAGSAHFATNYVHGFELLEGGDVVFNIEYLGLVRMGPCGEVRWRVSRRNHHSVERDAEGYFWTMGYRRIPSAAENDLVPALQPPFGVDTLVRVSPEGEVVREIDVAEVLIDSGYQYLLPKHGRFSGDLLHGNDVETLSPDMADAFEDFEAGDLLVSLYEVDSIFVIDRETLDVKFHFSRGLVGQHDPDFLPSGRISIFNNRECQIDGACDAWGDTYGGSEILVVDPQTRQTERVVGHTEATSFYTRRVGRHQYTADGNVLVTETRGGRVFEVDDGEVVWEWIHRPYEGAVPEVAGAARYAVDERTVESWTCDDG